jgi:hypothetical protein
MESDVKKVSPAIRKKCRRRGHRERDTDSQCGSNRNMDWRKTRYKLTRRGLKLMLAFGALSGLSLTTRLRILQSTGAARRLLSEFQVQA